MSDRLLFVYDNLKVGFHPADAPYDGFEILAGEANCTAEGTLFDLGQNAGYIPIGSTVVRGQIWATSNLYLIQELKDFAYPDGNVKRDFIYVKIVDEDDDLVVPASVFTLDVVPDFAKRIESGFWSVRYR